MRTNVNSPTNPRAAPEIRLTSEMFAVLIQATRLEKPDMIAAAREVMVDGAKPVDAAARHGTTRQQLNGTLRKLRQLKPIFDAYASLAMDQVAGDETGKTRNLRSLRYRAPS